MSVNTKTVTNRRRVSYQRYDDLLADAEELAKGTVNTVGNWSYGQILEHLAVTLDSSIDGFPFRAPIPMRLVAKLFMKSKFLGKGFPAGLKIPKEAQAHFVPKDSVSSEAAVDHLRRAIERCKTDTNRVNHPIFDQLTLDEWESFNLRHGELHMSFVAPAEG